MKHQGTVELETNRLILRKIKMSDAPAAFDNWTGDDEVTEFLRWKTHRNIEETEGVFKQWIDNYSKNDFYLWVIVLKSEMEPIGTIAVVDKNEKCDKVHIGYCIGSKWWRQGIVTEAFACIIKFFFELVKVNRIESQHDPRNPNSGRVMQKCGLIYEGILREDDVNNKGICDAVMYSLLAKDYFNQQNEKVSKNIIENHSNFDTQCVFCNICAHNIPSNIVYESDAIMAILDIDPINEGHILIIPKTHTDSIINISTAVMNAMFQLAKKIITIYKELYQTEAYTLMQNGGECCDFGHFHLHIFPRTIDDKFEIKCNESRKFDDLKIVLDKIIKLMPR